MIINTIKHLIKVSFFMGGGGDGAFIPVNTKKLSVQEKNGKQENHNNRR